MKKVDVLLINLPVDSNSTKNVRRKVNSFPPLGIMYIATVLKQYNVKVAIRDYSVINITKVDLLRELEELSPKMIGFSTYNESWKAQQTITKLVRNNFPRIKIVAGGAFATFCYKDMFANNLVDYVIKGEGEFSVYELYKRLFLTHESISDIPGLVFYDKEKRLISNAPQRIKNLDTLPFVDFDMIDISKYTIGIAIITSRGCPGDCIFCSSKAFFGRKIFLRSAHNLYEEIKSLQTKYRTNIFYFTDDTFTINKQRVYELCSKLINDEANFIWGCESRADVLNDEDLVIALAKAGCRKMQIGLESGDNEILRKLRKYITIEEVERAIQLTTKHGISVQISYILGHVFDTKETIMKTISFVKYLEKKYGVFSTCSINTPFPGTEQFIKAEEYGMKIYAQSWDEYKFDNAIISTKYLSPDDIKNFFNYTLTMKNE